MKSREFRIPTTWRVRGSTARVFDALSKPHEFVRWWPDVYLAVREVKAGDATGIGRVVRPAFEGLAAVQIELASRGCRDRQAAVDVAARARRELAGGRA